MKRLIVATMMACALSGATASADDSAACTGFSWPMDREAGLFAAPGNTIASGATLEALPTTALRLTLVSQSEAAFPVPPRRAPKTADVKGGWVTLPAPAAPGTYQVTLSTRGWIDAVQSGKILDSAGFSSDGACKAMHKSVRFELAAEPVTIQLSDIAQGEVTLTILPTSYVLDAPPVTAPTPQ